MSSHANLFVGNQEVCFKLDSGADANVLPLDTYERLGPSSSLMQTNTVLTAFGNAKNRPEGEAKFSSRKSTYVRDLCLIYSYNR